MCRMQAVPFCVGTHEKIIIPLRWESCPCNRTTLPVAGRVFHDAPGQIFLPKVRATDCAPLLSSCVRMKTGQMTACSLLEPVMLTRPSASPTAFQPGGKEKYKPLGVACGTQSLGALDFRQPAPNSNPTRRVM